MPDRRGASRDAAYVHDIADSCRTIEAYVRGKSLAHFLTDVMLQDAIARRLFVIGEATKNLSDEYKTRVSSIDWKNIARLRDKLGHHYWAIEIEKFWEIAINHVRPLREAVEVSRTRARRRP